MSISTIKWVLGHPWQYSGEDSAIQLQGVQAQSLFGELISHMPHGMAKKKKKKGSITPFLQDVRISSY